MFAGDETIAYLFLSDLAEFGEERLTDTLSPSFWVDKQILQLSNVTRQITS